MKIQNILNVWILKSQKRKKHYRSCTRFLKWIRIQQVHVSSLHLKYALQNKFLNQVQVSTQIENVHKNANFLSNCSKLWALQNSDLII